MLDTNTVWMKQLGTTTKIPNVTNANTGTEYAYSIAIDKDNHIHIACETNGPLGKTNLPGKDLFILKMDSDGNIIWLTQLGADTKKLGVTNANEGNDRCEDIAVDDNGNVYCAGYTTGAIGEGNAGSSNAFILKLDSTGDIV